MTTIVKEVIMKVIVVRRKKLLIELQVMKKWMIKMEMNQNIQIMKVVIKIKELKSRCFSLLFLFAHS
jgi:hypothetical protein